MRFGPRWKAEGIEEILDEAFALTPEIYITEYGSDAKVQKWGEPRFKLNDQAQAEYLQQLTEHIQQYCIKRSRPIKGLFCWSDLRIQLEWENGHECQLGMINPIINERRQMIGWNSTPASKYLKGAYQKPAEKETN